MGVLIGIDFGTTNSLCAWLDGERPQVIPNGRGRPLTPSAVAVDARGGLLIGDAARNQALVNPGNTILNLKRHLAAEGRLSLGDRAWRPEELVALILGSLRADAERQLGQSVRRAVIAAPAHFSDRERRALVEAGRLAGLEIARVVNEPTAAALARAWRLSAPGRGGAGAGTAAPATAGAGPGRRASGPSIILVYDFGGGTFDVSLLRQEGGSCVVLASRGDGRLGGADLDRELQRRVAASFLGEYGLDVEADRYLAQQVAEQAERAKIELSERGEASVALPFALPGGKGGAIVHPRRDFSRAEFEELARPFVERSMELVALALADARLTAAEVTALVLSGGSSRIPLVRETLAARFGLRPEGGVNPEEIVALGAAVSAAVEGGAEATAGFSLRDVVSRSYGVEIDGGKFVTLIGKNSPVPATAKRVFSTVADAQESVEIHVLQGESGSAAENLSLGRFLLSGIRRAASGAPRIGVSFSIDESDILHVSAKDLDTGSAEAIHIADLDRGAADEPPPVLLRKARLLGERIGELRTGLRLEAGLEAELDEAAARALRADDGDGEGELRLLKAELEGLVGELLARRAEGVAR